MPLSIRLPAGSTTATNTRTAWSPLWRPHRRSASLASVLLVLMLAPSFAETQAPPASPAGSADQRQGEAKAGDPREVWIRQVIGTIASVRARHPIRIASAARVSVAFRVARDGHLLESRVAVSSGLPATDKIALALLRAAAPFPPMPAAMSDDDFKFVLPLRFEPPAPTKPAPGR